MVVNCTARKAPRANYIQLHLHLLLMQAGTRGALGSALSATAIWASYCSSLRSPRAGTCR